jgi:hypothetical protein
MHALKRVMYVHSGHDTLTRAISLNPKSSLRKVFKWCVFTHGCVKEIEVYFVFHRSRFNLIYVKIMEQTIEFCYQAQIKLLYAASEIQFKIFNNP